jgi:hypothetical protein
VTGTGCCKNRRAPLALNMSSKRSPPKMYEWRVIMIKASPARLVGYFTACSAEDAVKEAIEQKEITRPHEQERLAII